MENEKISGNYYETKVSGLKLKAVWDAESTNTFCELYIKEVEAGHQPGTHFDKVGWEKLCKNFNTATRRICTKAQLKNKWDDLIGKETGLGWNSKKKTIDASDEWWLSKLQFDRMFMNTTKTGDYAWTPASRFVPSESKKISTENVSLIESSGDSYENNIQETSKDILSKRSREQLGKQSTRWMKGKKKKKKKAKVGRAAISETSFAYNKTPEFTITQCIEVLKDIPRQDKPLYFFATDLFCAKEKREVFMAMDEADKLSWLTYEHAHAG
ncbi:hypothetical protein UlMin_043280 [Ulmus minor]